MTSGGPSGAVTLADSRRVQDTEARLRPLTSPESEYQVLGQIIQFPDALDEVASRLTPEMFSDPANTTLYRVILELHAAGTAVDVVTTSEALEQRGQLEQVGGMQRLSELLDCAPTGANARYHAEIVEDRALFRAIQSVAGQIARDVATKDKRNARQILDQAESRITSLASRTGAGDAVPIQRSVPAALERLKRRQDAPGSSIGLATGFTLLDRMTAGLKPGELIYLAARPSMGKTALMLNVASAVAAAGTPVLIMSLEQSAEELTDRLICAAARVDSYEFRRGRLSPTEVDRVGAAADHVARLPIVIEELPGGSILSVRATVRRLRRQTHFGLVCLDYIQLLGGTRDNRVQEVAEISRGMKMLARELRIPILALSQLSREVEKRKDKRPQLSDLRDSGALEQDGDLVVFVFRQEHYETDKAEQGKLRGLAEVIVAKQRNGPTGMVPLFFHKEYMRFEDVDAHSRNYSA